MTDVAPILTAGVVGFLSGFLISVPVGPVNLTIVNETTRRGFGHGLLITLGAVAMEVVYCGIAFTGFATFFTGELVKAAMELVSFVFLVFLGFKFLLARTVMAPTHLTDATDRLEARIEERLHPHTAFMTGFVRVMANPGVLVFWVILAANFISRGWVRPNLQSRAVCVAGVTLGVAVWWVGLSWVAAQGRARLGERTLLLIEKSSGVALLLVAAWHGVRLVHALAQHGGRLLES